MAETSFKVGRGREYARMISSHILPAPLELKFAGHLLVPNRRGPELADSAGCQAPLNLYSSVCPSVLFCIARRFAVANAGSVVYNM